MNTKNINNTVGAPDLVIQVRTLVTTGHIQEAEKLLLDACLTAPQNGVYAVHLGRFYLSQRRIGEAIAPLQAAVLLSPDDPAPRKMLTMALRGLQFTAFDPATRKALVSCLQDPHLPHQLLNSAWFSLVRLDPALQGAMALFRAPNFEEFKKGIDRFPFHDDLFLWGIRRLIISDPVIERGLTFVRRWFLEAGASDHFPFLCALSRYCFYTEYAFLSDVAETAAFAVLRQNADTPQTVALLGCYEPLAAYPKAREFITLAENSQDDAFKDLVGAQVSDPLAERALAVTIPALEEIQDDVSRAVRDQYEENPYPRWASIGSPTLSDAVKEQARGKKILVAGCGTGKEAAEIARLFPFAAVTAIDLSRASLSYAIRQCEELGIVNIRFLQADILKIGAIGDTFDLIVSSGVLHHMNDPIVGWRSLMGVLKPNGLIKIALYSTAARRFIRQSRALIVEKGWTATLEDMRAYRRYIFDLPDSDPLRQRMTAAPDFYTLSTLRDLVFHVQEHTFSLPQIQAIADDLKLNTVRVDVTRSQDMTAYRATFPDDPACADLGNWNKLEDRDPDMFAGMYSIWFCRAESKGNVDFGWIKNTAHNQ